MPVYDLLNPTKYVDKTLTKQRRELCNTCPERLAEYNNKPLTKTDQCPECHCFIHFKTMLSDDNVCPLGDW